MTISSIAEKTEKSRPSPAVRRKIGTIDNCGIRTFYALYHACKQLRRKGETGRRVWEYLRDTVRDLKARGFSSSTIEVYVLATDEALNHFYEDLELADSARDTWKHRNSFAYQDWE